MMKRFASIFVLVLLAAIIVMAQSPISEYLGSGGAAPAGNDGDVQVKAGSGFAGSAAFTFDSDVVTVANSVLIGNTVAGLGGAPVAGSFLIGDQTYGGAGTPAFQFERTETDPAAYTQVEANLYWNTGADMTDLISQSWVSYFGGSDDYINGVFPGATVANYFSANATTSGAVETLVAHYTTGSVTNSAVTQFALNWAKAPQINSGSVSTMFGDYTTDFGGVASNAYYSWIDSRGVYRIREDSTFDSVGQAIGALYNPQFTKYTPGAANFERCIPGCQWNGNVAEYGTEKGGTGTLHPVRLIGSEVQIQPLSTNGVVTTSSGTGMLQIDTSITSGTWTPTLTNVANITASTSFQCQYLRIGATVTGSCRVSVDPTTTVTSTQLGISLPVASNFGAVEDAAGSCSAEAIAGQSAAIRADTANDRMEMRWVAADVTDQPMTCSFSYQVL